MPSNPKRTPPRSRPAQPAVPRRKEPELPFDDGEVTPLRADDPRPQRVAQYPTGTKPRRKSEEGIPTSVYETDKHDEELAPSYDPNALSDGGFKPAFLYVERGPGAGQLIPIKQGQLVIGRASVSDLRLQHPSISRRHAQLTRHGERFYIKDLGSQNGTFVNKQRIATEIEIYPGDMVALGNAIVKLRGPLQPGQAPVTPGKPTKSEVRRSKSAVSSGRAKIVSSPTTGVSSAVSSGIRKPQSSALKVAIFAGAVGAGVAAVLVFALLRVPSSPTYEKLPREASKSVDRSDRGSDVRIDSDPVVVGKEKIDQRLKEAMAERKPAPAPAPAPAEAEAEPSALAAAKHALAKAAPAHVAGAKSKADEAFDDDEGSGAAPAPAASSPKRAAILAAYEKGDADTALELAKKSGDKDLINRLTSFTTAYTAAQQAIKQKNGAAAVKNYQAALDVDNTLSSGWSKYGTEIRKQLGQLWTLVGMQQASADNTEEARTAFQQALKYDPENEKAKDQLGKLGGGAAPAAAPSRVAAAPAKKSASKIDDAFGDDDEKPAAKAAPAPAARKSAPAAKPASSAAKSKIDEAFGD